MGEDTSDKLANYVLIQSNCYLHDIYYLYLYKYIYIYIYICIFIYVYIYIHFTLYTSIAWQYCQIITFP